MQNKPLRILHCANFNEKILGATFYATDYKISNGLIRNGHFVHNFSYRDVARNLAFMRIRNFGKAPMNRELIATVDQINPDLLLLGHSELVDNETLEVIKARRPSIKIAMWWVDWVANMTPQRALYERRLNIADHVFLTTDPDIFKAEFAVENADRKMHFMPNICDSSVETGQAFAKDDHLHDIVFIGRPDMERKPLITHLQERFKEFNVGIYGQTLETLLLGDDYNATLAQCFIGINFNRRNDIPLASSDRLLHMVANGCLVMSPNVPRLDEIFSDKEIVYFDDFKDFEDKARYYLTHRDEARQIAEAGYRRAHRDYEAQKVVENMLTTIFSDTA
jgi:hypothetical protein